MEFLTFSGRAGRLEYLGIAIAASVVHTVNAMVFVDFDEFGGGASVTSPLFLILFVGATLVTWSAAIRRCHDLGRSGFFLLWQFVPLLGLFAAFYLLLARGDDMKNRFGAPPWSVTNRAEKRAELERVARTAAMAEQVNPEKAWVTGDGTFDMDGLWNESNISR